MERKLQSHFCNVIKKPKKPRWMKYPEVKMGFHFWWRRLEFCHSHEAWVLSLSNAAGITRDIHLYSTTKKEICTLKWWGILLPLVFFCNVKTSPCPRTGLPCSPLPCPHFRVTLTLQAFAFTVSPFSIFFFWLWEEVPEPTHFLVPTTIWNKL